MPVVRTRWIVPVLGAVIVSLVIGQRQLATALEREAVIAPAFEVDPLWPKPLPNGWVLGMVIGLGIDSRDHIFIVHRGASTLNSRTEAGYPLTGPCCSSAPPVLEFDPEGNLVNSWGGPATGYVSSRPLVSSAPVRFKRLNELTHCSGEA